MLSLNSKISHRKSGCLFHCRSIVCHGAQGDCRSVICVNQLQEHLSSDTLEDLLEPSFASHIKRNPDDLRYCPTPDCHFQEALPKQHDCHLSTWATADMFQPPGGIHYTGPLNGF